MSTTQTTTPAATEAAPGASVAAPQPAGERRPGFFLRYLRKGAAVAAALFLIALAAACFLAPWIAPYASDATDFAAASQGPSAAHWLGTDTLGRDVYSRLLYGGANTLGPALLTVAVAFAIGVPVGILSGFKAGRTDQVVSSILDGIIAVPSTIFLLAVLAVFPHNIVIAMVVFGILISPPVAKVVRSATLGVRAEQYIDFARISGIGDLGIMWKHVRSKVAGVIVVQMTLVSGVAVVVQSGLEFLGLGPQPPTATWGNLISDAAELIHTRPWMLVPTGGIITLTTLALWFVGDGVRDSLAERWQGPPATRRSARARKLVANQRLAAATTGGGASRPSDALVSVDGVTVSFGHGASRIPVVQNVGFEVAAGETVALLGESGCGKSVTARAVAGLLPPSAHVDGGTAVFEGKTYELSDDGDTLPRGNGISMIFQEPVAALDPSLTVGTILTNSLRRHAGLDRKAARARALELLAQVDIRDPENVLKLYPHEISGGMAQRVCIARALAADPKFLIADEPTTALDVTVQAGVLNLLRERQALTDLAVLFVTHDWGVVADIADRCVVMYAGEVVEVGTVDDLFDDARHPYSRALLEANPSQGVPGERLAALPGRVPSPNAWPEGCRFQSRCPFATAACAAGPIPLTSTDDGRKVRCIRWEELRRDAN
ncbi:dipeptide/oligopeptide/nickel ABC transporter permease/ATP-binding protein [Arthrobacter ginkgonis]|uniref:Dipeptide/oligopeptide/nickel ABC transporter permease/ATP-binding protein n=1 Tax=Arthrobacter ginkgonis TaxID=1630594 RepID=A0ABP7BRA4_9MICC